MSNLPQRLIDDESRKHLLGRFSSEFKEEVLVELFLGEENPEYAEFTEKLIDELREIEKRIIVKKYNVTDEEFKKRDLKMTPSVMIGYDKGYKVEYWGAPAGYETSAFIETLIMVSKNNSGLSENDIKDLEYIDKEVKLYSFVTPSCHYCPKSTELNNKIAIAKKGLVRAVCVEAYENMELSNKFDVSSVPQQNINDDLKSKTVGVQPESTFIDQILSYSSSKYDEMKKVKVERDAKLLQLSDNPNHPLKLTDKNFHEAINKYNVIVVDCWAEWCVPCKMIAPVIEELAKEQAGRIVFGKVDTDHNPVVSNQFGIRSIPTLLIFKNGEKVGQVVGAKPKAAILKEVEKYL